ncbi:ribbon-helix-helix protein, CopG family [Candidatus Micrarchaeota archaeon]|nr:ribbon-helix-helix protein, CopG family [Candidatus Micrarchaeota archaeon]
MEIVSLSLDRATLDELNRLKKELGFSSRSRLLRASISSFANEYRALETRKGHCDAVFTVTYRKHEGKGLARMMSRFEEIIRTEIHQHHEGTCLRILVLCGSADKVRELFTVLKKEKDVRSVHCSIL